MPDSLLLINTKCNTMHLRQYIFYIQDIFESGQYSNWYPQMKQYNLYSPDEHKW